MKKTRTIKRYQNRKLYDTHRSSYVTLEEIAHIIRSGSDIKVIDNRTGKDITYMTQIQLLFDQEKKSYNKVKTGDAGLLTRVIRSEGGVFTSYIRDMEAGMDTPSMEKEFTAQSGVETETAESATLN